MVEHKNVIGYRVLKMCWRPTISPFTFTFSPVIFFIEHGFSNNFYVYVNCRYHVLLIYIFLSITFTIAINRTLTNPPSSKYIQLLVTSRWELRTSTTQHFGLHLVLLYRCAKRSEWIVCSWRIRSRHIPKLGYPFTECKNKQGNRWRFNGFSVI